MMYLMKTQKKILKMYYSMGYFSVKTKLINYYSFKNDSLDIVI